MIRTDRDLQGSLLIHNIQTVEGIVVSSTPVNINMAAPHCTSNSELTIHIVKQSLWPLHAESTWATSRLLSNTEVMGNNMDYAKAA